MINQDQDKFDTICFNKKCIKDNDQLFSSKSHSHTVHQSHQQFTKKLDGIQFYGSYKCSQKIRNNLMRILKKRLQQDFNKNMQGIQKLLKKGILKQLNRYINKFLQRYDIKYCNNILKNLRNHKNRLNQYQQIQFLNHLYYKQIHHITKLINRKLSVISDSVHTISSKIIHSFQNKIVEIFATCLEPNQLKLEEEEQQEEVEEEEEEKEQKNNIILMPAQPQEQESKQQIVGNNIQGDPYLFLGRNDRKRRVINYTKINKQDNSEQKNVDKCQMIMICSQQDIKVLKLKQDQKRCLIIRYNIQFKNLIEMIEQIKPIKIIILSQIINIRSNLLDYISPKILKRIIHFEVGSYYTMIFNDFLDDKLGQYKSYRIQINLNNWKNLSLIQNLQLYEDKDIVNIRESNIKLSKIRILKIELDSINIIKQLQLLDINKLQILIIKNIKINYQLSLSIINIIQRNRYITTIIFQSIYNIPENILHYITQIKLKKIAIHLQSCQIINHFIFTISTLQYISFKNVKIILPSSKYSNKLTMLKYIDLCNINGFSDGTSDCMSQIHAICSQSYKNIYHLNISSSQIHPQEFINLLKSLPNLTELNINFTNIPIYLWISHAKGLHLQKLSLLGYIDIDDINFQDNSPTILPNNFLQMLNILSKLKILNLGSLKLILQANKIKRKTQTLKLFRNGLQTKVIKEFADFKQLKSQEKKNQ